MRTGLALLLCLVLAGFYARTQPRIGYHNGVPYDAETYWYQARLVERNQPIKNWAPFVFRLGAPYLVGAFYPSAARWIHAEAPAIATAAQHLGPKAGAALDPEDLLDGFTWLAFLSAIATAMLLYSIFRGYALSRGLSLFLLAIWIANPNSPFRFALYYPALTDPLGFVFFWAMFWIYRRWPNLGLGPTLALCVLGFAGALVREVVLALPLVFLGAYATQWFRGQPRAKPKPTSWHALAFLWPVLVTAGGIWATRHMVEAIPLEDPSRNYTFLGHAKLIWHHHFNNLSLFPLCLFTSIGPFLAWIGAGLVTRPVWSFLRMHRELLIFLPGMAVVAYSGGLHTDRFVFWSLPGWLILLGFLIQNQIAVPKPRVLRWAFFAILVVAQILTYRAFLPFPEATNNTLAVPQTPEHLYLAAYGEHTTWGQVTSASMEPWARLQLLVQFGCLTLGLWVLQFLGRNRNASPAKAPEEAP